MFFSPYVFTLDVYGDIILIGAVASICFHTCTTDDNNPSSCLFSELFQKMTVPLYHLLIPAPVLLKWICHSVRLPNSAQRRYLVSDKKSEKPQFWNCVLLSLYFFFLPGALQCTEIIFLTSIHEWLQHTENLYIVIIAYIDMYNTVYRKFGSCTVTVSHAKQNKIEQFIWKWPSNITASNCLTSSGLAKS